MKQCPCCKQPLGDGYPNRTFCSETCRNRGMPKKCRQCGEMFRPWKRGLGRFCSIACAGRWAASRVRFRMNCKGTCRHCGTKFVGLKSRKFCSVLCQQRFTVKPCEECGKMFQSTQPSKTRPAKRFCGFSCRVKWTNRTVGSKHHLPTPQELAIKETFPKSTLHFRVNTGRRFARNVPHHYEIDVAFPDIRLAVELDGGFHSIKSRQKKDQERTKELNKLGWKVLRFSNRQVTKDLIGVMDAIASSILKLGGTLAIRSTALLFTTASPA